MFVEDFAQKLIELSSQASNKKRIDAVADLFESLSADDLAAGLFMLEPRNKILKKLDISTQRLALVVARHEGERLGLSWLKSAVTTTDPRTLRTFVDEAMALVPQPAQPLSSRLERLGRFMAACSRATGWLFLSTVTDQLTIGIGRENLIRSIGLAFQLELTQLREACAADVDLFSVDFKALGSLTPLKPFRPMLASVFKMPVEGEHLWQKKQDGFRVLIHLAEGVVKVFSRGQQDVTLTTEALVRKHLDSRQTLILDGQVVHTGGFQQVARIIRRKKGFEPFLQDLRLKVFDILYFDGPVTHWPYRQRRALLQRLMPELLPQSGPFDEPTTVLAHAVERRWEGVMVKALAAPYAIGRRTKYWYKLKEDFRELDVAVVGYQAAEGRKEGIGSFILGIRCGTTIETIGKVGTGFTDQARRSLLQVLGRTQPVCTVKYQAVSISPRAGSGFALRFPVFVCIREDKTWSDVATHQELAELSKLC